MHAVSAAGALIIFATCDTFELAQMKNPMHAVSAASASFGEAAYNNTFELTP